MKKCESFLFFSKPKLYMSSLRTSPFVAFVEGICLVGEFFVVMVLFEMGSNNVLRTLNYYLESLENNTTFFIVMTSLYKLLSIFLSSVLVLFWMTFRHSELLKSPEKPISKYFGMLKFNRIPSKTLLFLPIILGKRTKNEKHFPSFHNQRN